MKPEHWTAKVEVQAYPGEPEEPKHTRTAPAPAAGGPSGSQAGAEFELHLVGTARAAGLV